jgi:hypothetical protein
VFCVCFLFLRERSLAEGAREQRDLYISLSLRARKFGEEFFLKIALVQEKETRYGA